MAKLTNSWKTTALGFILIALACYTSYSKQAIDLQDSAILLTGVGLLAAKDSNNA